jgi:hypothetical protein
MTAVEWFEQRLNELDVEIPYMIFAHALELEKQQIINAYYAGNENILICNPQQYYETIKNETK